MKPLSTDIRIFNIPKHRLLQLIKEFMELENFDVVTDVKVSENVTEILSQNRTESNVKLLWNRNPQVLRWIVKSLNNKESRVELLFSLKPSYRVWFWKIFLLCWVGVLFFFYVAYQLSPIIQLSFPFFILSLFFLFAVLFLGLRGNSDFRGFVSSFVEFLSTRSDDYSEKVIHSRLDSSEGTKIAFVFIFFGALPIFKSFFENDFYVLLIPLFFVIILCLMWLFLRSGPLRLIFLSLSFTVIIPTVLLYTPMIANYSVAGDLSIQYNQVISSEKLLEKHPDNVRFKQSAKVLKNSVKLLFFLFGFIPCAFYVFWLIFFLATPKVAERVMQYRRDIPLYIEWSSSQKSLIGKKNYLTRYNFFILLFWITSSALVYYFAFLVFALFELDLFNTNFLFSLDIVNRFYSNLILIVRFLFSPYIGLRLADVVTRFFILLYCFPLLFIIFFVVKKRLCSFLWFLKLRNNHLFRNQDDTVGILNEIKKISNYFSVFPPIVYVLPSNLPFAKVGYVGFPFFYSYLLLSEGCFNLRKEELKGVLAHELYHIKMHSVKWYFLNLLSDITLFGTGFLVMVIDSYKQELDADYHAAVWVKKYGSIVDFVRGLQIMGLAGGESGVGGIGSSGEFVDVAGRFSGNGSLFDRLKRMVNLVLDLYFGDDVLNYIYPSLEERIERIKAIAAE